MDSALPKILMIIVGKVFLIGLLLMIPATHQFFRLLGNLPGDIRIEKENMKLYFPLATSILLSLVLSLILYLFRK